MRKVCRKCESAVTPCREPTAIGTLKLRNLNSNSGNHCILRRFHSDIKRTNCNKCWANMRIFRASIRSYSDLVWSLLSHWWKSFNRTTFCFQNISWLCDWPYSKNKFYLEQLSTGNAFIRTFI